MQLSYALSLMFLGGTLVRLCRYLFDGKTRPPARSDEESCSIAVFLGSGGHTSEAFSLLSGLDFARYRPRTYVVSHGDRLSAKKAVDFETVRSSDTSPHTASYKVITIPRARRVHQPLLTTPFSSAWSLAVCIYHVSLAPIMSGTSFADVLILNGPGTCIMLVLATYLNKLMGLPSPRLIYVESFARVKRLSLSGKILHRLVDRFIVQWPDLAERNAHAEYRGWLV